MNDTIDQLGMAVQAFSCLSTEVMERQVMLAEQQKRVDAHPNIIGAIMDASKDVRRLRQRAREQLLGITRILDAFRQNPDLTPAECGQIAGLCHQALEMCLASGLDGTSVIEAEMEFRGRCQF